LGWSIIGKENTQKLLNFIKKKHSKSAINWKYFHILNILQRSLLPNHPNFRSVTENIEIVNDWFVVCSRNKTDICLAVKTQAHAYRETLSCWSRKWNHAH
jgi:hypothetical protein